ncbi:MAG: DUF3488 domain-containing protein [Deltaproteobacteria bacterium]|nr:DUF3488 domain-containing protein [Deltaproteobacteria bacterium]
MQTQTSYTSRLAVVTIAISLSGILSLSLAGMLAWPVFGVLAIFHLIVYKRFYGEDLLPAGLVGTATLIIFCLEVIRIWMGGKEMIIPALRDTIVVLAVTRLILRKGARQIYQIIGISLAGLLFATILTTSLVFLIGLVLMVFIIPAALYYLDGLNFEGDQYDRAPRAFHWLAVGLSIVVLTSLLFYIIPRPCSTIVGLGLTHQRKTGFSEEINLKSASPIEEDTHIVMRIIWEEGHSPKTFYLAGARLEKITDHGFEKSPAPTKDFMHGGRPVDRLTIYPTGLDDRNVFFPFRIVDISPDNIAIQGANYYWKDGVPPVYDVWLSRTPVEGSPCSISLLPKRLDAVGSFGKAKAGEGSSSDKAERIMAYLKDRCTYSMKSLDIPANMSPIEWFVFNGRKGSCEYFASALAVMLRGSGIPSRVVTGFYVHEYNPSGNYYIVRACDAHAWVEYWDGLPLAGWRIADPTPRASDIYVSKASIIDAIRFRWIRWVIHYSLEDQIHFAGYVRLNTPDIMRHAIGSLPFICASLFGLGLIYLIVRRKRMSVYDQIIMAFAKRGIRLDRYTTHEGHLVHIESLWPCIAPYFKSYLRDYLAWRFGDKSIDIKPRTEDFLDKLKSTPLP